ncbi:hypothetical protein ILUMI_23660 [Ignelater luminosus]|uniref:THAP-type domain-containing protein n=1 Tax=Ignelater luminosus TaxID=2038154 RepID=A0A8K0G1P9_IGNLU|nr:hypothetical protein ILUMI_23660 [Ignelater luminosus]
MLDTERHVVSTCCVPACRSNYDQESEKVSVFSFPKDPNLQSKWIKAICREDFIITKNSKVCKLHFRDVDIETTVNMWDEKTGKKVTAPLSYPKLAADAIPVFVPGCPSYLSSTSTSATSRESPEARRNRLENDFLRKTISENVESYAQYKNKVSVETFEDLKFKIDNFKVPDKWIIMKHEKRVNFLLICNPQNPKLQCSVGINEDLSVFVFVENVKLTSIGNLRLPEYIKDMNVIDKLLSDINQRISEREDSGMSEDKLVILLMDEIHLKENFYYKWGYIVGNAFNDEKLAKSAHVFMISSLMSPYKEVVHILPVNKMTGEVLHTFLKNIVIGLHNIGFEVLGVVSDNHSINRKAISYFSNSPEVKIVYPNPADENKPLYFVIDTVHILKNVRNNWLNKRNQDFKYPNFSNMEISETASFEALKEMHASESTSLLKYGFNLSLKTLYPSNLERQNVKLAVNIFNSSISIALKELGPRKHFKNWEGTANCIEIISRWWDIVNVKTPLKGQRLRNIQTDNLEERFGKYRQLAGSQYHVSVRQIFESEAKLRIQAVMPLALTSHNFGRKCECNVADILANCMVDKDDLDEISDTM